MVKVTGHDAVIRHLKGVSGKDLHETVGHALYGGARLITEHAQGSIMTGSASGKSHKPSKPGSPPSNDTRHLHDNIVAVQVSNFLSEVQSNAEYAAIQELGGTIDHPGGTPYFIGKDGMATFVSKDGPGAHHHLPVTKPHKITLPERPYLRPATEAKRKEVVDTVQKGVDALVRKAQAKAGAK